MTANIGQLTIQFSKVNLLDYPLSYLLPDSKTLQGAFISHGFVAILLSTHSEGTYDD